MFAPWTCLAFVLSLGCSQPGASSAAAKQDAYVWWEAESAVRTNFPSQNPFAPANEKEAAVLSEGKWIGAEGKRETPLFAEYEVRVPAKGVWNVYARKFWKHGPFRWRFDSGAYTQVGDEVSLLDSEELRQFLVANWTPIGRAELDAGSHTFRIETTTNEGAVAFDAFVMTQGAFEPNGKLRPGVKRGSQTPGWFAFEPGPDPYEESPIDLRYLNERFAGEHGFIQSRGDTFVHSKTGKPERFWAVNTGPDGVRMDPASVDAFARFLAKKGVNMIRCHGSVWNPDLSLDLAYLDKLQYFVSAMKKQGIYTTLSIYFPLWLRADAAHGFEGYNGSIPFALLFFDEEFQRKYRSWWKGILETPNKYTGVPLGKDPAVAFLEIVNEDSYLFWTFTPYENIPEPAIGRLEARFGAWLVTKYGSLQKAFSAWGGDPVRGDDANSGRAGFLPLWAVSNQRTQRSKDTAAFLTLDQREFFAKTTRYLKQDLGFQGSVYGSNWITADARVLGPLDKYSNLVADHLDRHGYFGGKHKGERASYSLNAGERYSDRSATGFEPEDPNQAGSVAYDTPLADLIYNDRPSTITEVNWPMPNRFRAEFPILASLYGALQGTDGVFFFAQGVPGYDRTLNKFGIASPAVEGQFPATALMYRQGLVQMGPEVVRASLSTADMFDLAGAPVVAPQNLDQLRAADVPSGETSPKIEGIDPAAFYVGRVVLDIQEKPGREVRTDLSKFIDRDAKKISSATGELEWNYGAKRVTARAPKAVAATGFLGASPVDLGAVRIEGFPEFGAVAMVSLDGAPLATSKKVLLQVMTEETNEGWRTSGEPLRTIESTGGAPILVKQLSGKAIFPDARKVTPLDLRGYQKTGQAFVGKELTLAPDVLYYLVERVSD